MRTLSRIVCLPNKGTASKSSAKQLASQLLGFSRPVGARRLFVRKGTEYGLAELAWCGLVDPDFVVGWLRCVQPARVKRAECSHSQRLLRSDA